MTDPIKLQRAEFRDHFKQELKELKRMGKNENSVRLLNGTDNLAEEITTALKALADDKETVTIGDHTFKRADLKQRDVKPLMKLATEFFSTRRNGLLSMDLLDSLHGMKRSVAWPYVNRALRTLTENNEPLQKTEGDNTAKAINDTIAQAKSDIKKYKKQRRIAAIPAVAGAIVALAAIPVALFGSLIALPFFMIVGTLAFAAGVQWGTRCAEKISTAHATQEFWTYALTFRETDEFKEYQKLFNETEVDTNSMAFLEAAALTHKKIACKTTKVIFWNEFLDDHQLTKAEEKLRPGFKEINRAYLASKDIAMYESKQSS